LRYLTAHIWLLVGALVVCGVVWFLQPEKVPVNKDTSTPLQKDETARVIVQDRKLVAITRKGTSVTYVPSSGTAVVSVAKDGTITSKVQKLGFKLQLGGGAIYADQLRFSIDSQLFYWSRVSLHGGIGLADNPVVVPYVAVGYRLDQVRLANSSIGLGITPRKDFVMMFRTEF
jgi:hypothetical protein